MCEVTTRKAPYIIKSIHMCTFNLQQSSIKKTHHLCCLFLHPYPPYQAKVLCQAWMLLVPSEAWVLLVAWELLLAWVLLLAWDPYSQTDHACLLVEQQLPIVDYEFIRRHNMGEYVLYDTTILMS